MGGVAPEVRVQQINLYRPVATGTQLNPGAKVLLSAAVGVFVVVLLLALAGELYLSGVRADRDIVAQRLQQSQQRLAEAQSRLKPPPPDPFLEAERTRLTESAAKLHQTLDALAQHRAASGGGFSAIFEGLARNPVDGLWFNKVGLRHGGEHLWLRGQTLKAALVPKLLQTLAGEAAFTGRSFRKVSFERTGDEADSVIDFELRSADEGEQGDAG